MQARSGCCAGFREPISSSIFCKRYPFVFVFQPLATRLRRRSIAVPPPSGLRWHAITHPHIKHDHARYLFGVLYVGGKFVRITNFRERIYCGWLNGEDVCLSISFWGCGSVGANSS